MSNIDRLNAASTALRDFRFSYSLGIVADVARQTKLYSTYKNDFARIRILGYEQKLWDQANSELQRLIKKLAEELTITEGKQC